MMYGFTTHEGWEFKPHVISSDLVNVTFTNNQGKDVPPKNTLYFSGHHAVMRAKLFLACCSFTFLWGKTIEEHLEEAQKFFNDMEWEEEKNNFSSCELIYKGVRIWIREDLIDEFVELEFEAGMGMTQARMVYKDPYDAYVTLYGILCMLKNQYLGRPQPTESAILEAEAKLLDDGGDLFGLIVGCSMKEDFGDLGAAHKAIARIIERINPGLHQELMKEGTQHQHASKTLLELEDIYA